MKGRDFKGIWIPKEIWLNKELKLIEKIFFDMFDHQAKVFKFKKSLDYMELPNEADRGVLKLQDQVNILKGQLKDIVKVAHEPVIDLKEWEDVKSTIKLIQNKKVFKKFGK